MTGQKDVLKEIAEIIRIYQEDKERANARGDAVREFTCKVKITPSTYRIN